MSKNGKDHLLQATIQKNLMSAAYAKFSHERRVILERVAMVEQENERLRGALNASSNSYAAATGREREMRDAMDELIVHFDKSWNIDSLNDPPHDKDAPCYFCSYRDLDFETSKACQWCVHNPFGKMFEKTPTMVAIRKEQEANESGDSVQE